MFLRSRRAGLPPGLARSLWGRIPDLSPTLLESTGTVRRWASPPSAWTCRKRLAKRTFALPSSSSTQIQLAQVTSSSFRCLRECQRTICYELIDPAKDADGLHPTNLGRLVLRVNEEITSPLPCTPAGIIELIDRHGLDLHGKDICVLGRGVTVGRSIGLLLTRRAINATVTLCHTGTKDVAEKVRTADVVIAATGQTHMVKAHWIKPGAIVLDVGVSRVYDEAAGKYRIAGDIDPAVGEVASWVSPNPGGVGPMTRAMLLANVVKAAEQAATPS